MMDFSHVDRDQTQESQLRFLIVRYIAIRGVVRGRWDIAERGKK
jgi:hypothetical protein